MLEDISATLEVESEGIRSISLAIPATISTAHDDIRGIRRRRGKGFVFFVVFGVGRGRTLEQPPDTHFFG